MAGFSDLSNELILMVLEYILPDDIINFATTCRIIHELSTPIMREHKWLGARHQIWADAGGNQNLVTLLRSLLEYPQLALYIRVIHFCDRCDKLAGDPTKKDLKMFRTAFRNSHVITFDESDISLWMEEIRHGNAEPILGLLMTLLPCLVKIVFAGYRGEIPNFTKTIWRISKAYSSSPSSVFLSRLQYVVFDFGDSESLIEYDVLHPFLMLPSMRTLYTRRIPYHLGYPIVPMSSCITRIRLLLCGFNQKELLEFFGIFKSLEYLQFSPNEDEEEEDETQTFSPLWIHNALSTHARRSLKMLHIIDHYEYYDTARTGDFRNFDVLAQIEARFAFLLGKPGSSQKSLGDALPPSIEKVVIWGLDIDPDAVSKMVEDVVKDKERSLPKLNTLIYDQRFSRPNIETAEINARGRAWTLACKKVGIKFEICPRCCNVL